MLDKKPSGLMRSFEAFDLRTAQERFDMEFAHAVTTVKDIGGRVLHLPFNVLESLPFRTPEMLEVPEDLEDTLSRFEAFYRGEKDEEGKKIVFMEFFKPNDHFEEFVATIEANYNDWDIRPQYDDNDTRIAFSDPVTKAEALIDIHPQFDQRANALSGYLYKGTWAQ